MSYVFARMSRVYGFFPDYGNIGLVRHNGHSVFSRPRASEATADEAYLYWNEQFKVEAIIAKSQRCYV